MARRSAEYYRLVELTKRLERKNRDTILRFIRNVKSDVVLKKIADQISAGNIEDILKIFDRQSSVLGRVITDTYAVAGEAQASAMSASVGLAVSFDPSHPDAAKAAAADRERLIVGFKDSQRQMVRQKVTRGLSEGKGPFTIAREIKESIGLTAAQEEMVENYRKLLQGDEAARRQAKERALRDRRADKTIAASIANERPLTNKQVDSMVDRYRANAIANRAETITRTETARAVGQAREYSLDQVLEAAGIDEDKVVRVWNSSSDGNTRDTHRDMDQQQRRKGEPFKSPSGAYIRYPGDPRAPAAEVINCRCVLTTRILK